MIDADHDLPITRQAQLLELSRSAVYYRPQPPADADLALMRRIDELHLDHPFAGARMLRDMLRREGYWIGRKHVATLMRTTTNLNLLKPGRIEPLQVLVRDNNVDQALRVLKKKMQREGLFREFKARSAYEKPSEKRVREKAEAVRRQRKLARKKLQREGLLPAPKKAVRPAR